MTVRPPKLQDVDRPLVIRVTLDEPGDVEVHGSILVGSARPAFTFGPLFRDVSANVPIRIRIPITRRARRLVKRGARRGKPIRGILATNGRDTACFRNRSHSDRIFKVVP